MSDEIQISGILRHHLNKSIVNTVGKILLGNYLVQIRILFVAC